jgi:hypothetical protein
VTRIQLREEAFTSFLAGALFGLRCPLWLLFRGFSTTVTEGGRR